jgi:hypothetical protein
VIVKNLQTLKAIKKLIPIGFSRKVFTWLFTGLMGILIGTSIGASMMGQGEGVLLNSTLSINCFFIHI